MKRRTLKKEKRENADSRKEQFLSGISQKTQIPEEILLGCCKIAVTGQNELVIENYKSLLEYQSDRLVVLTRQCRVEICGKHLNLRYYTREEMQITGRIERIVYKK